MEEPLIKDIPSIKKALEDTRNIRALKRAMPLLRPVLRLFGVDTGNMGEALRNVEQLARQVGELAVIPDRFNDLLSDRGWIIYDSMNLEVAKGAIEKAEAGDTDGAEALLVNHYDVETVQSHLQRMYGVAAFHSRMPLAEKALEDYAQGRYYSCVLVILALLDGLVNEVHERRRGFFSEGVDLCAWDSIAAHSKGLNVLARILQKGRYSTTTEEITIPYRNGILHGMDLGYDNRMVAAKTWAALFATREWALRAEQGLVLEPPPESPPTWAGLAKQLAENAADRERIDEWKPREISIGEDISPMGEPECYEDGTPERRLAEYLHFWRLRNYGYMARCLSEKFGPPAGKAAAQVREVFQSKELKSFAFAEIADDAPAVTEIQTDLVFDDEGKEIAVSHRFRLLNLDASGNPAVRGKPQSGWTVITWGVRSPG